MTGGACAVHARELVAGYRWAGIGARRPVLRGITFALEPGTVTAVLGSNGAGKTTLLRVLAGFLRPRSGTVALDGSPPERVRRRRGLGYLPEGVDLPAGWRVGALVREGRRRARARGRSPDTLADPGLEPWLPRRTSALSRGITRRVALELALAGHPPLVILDEPFAGLDPPSREALARTIRELPRRGASVMIATHELGEVLRIADHVLVLARGRAGRPVRTEDVDHDALLSRLSGSEPP